jgi:SnoaL-like protein
MDLQTLSDREELVELIALYNKASFYGDVEGYARTFTTDGRYINANHGWVGFGGREAGDAIAAEYRNRTGLQHLCHRHQRPHERDSDGAPAALVRDELLRSPGAHAEDRPQARG